jgi:DnaJ-class molecular chaperone
MEKANHKAKKTICPRCRGNGYIKIPHESVERLNKSVIAQCSMCNSEGEIDELEDKIYDTIPKLSDDPNRMH